MSELSSETNPQILVNSKPKEQLDDAAAAEEQMSGLDEECSEDSVSAEKETQARVQSVFQQVRNRIRSQVAMKAPTTNILDLVQRVRDREMENAQMNREPEGEDVSSEGKKQAEVLTDDSKDEMDLRDEVLCVMFEKKLETSTKALRDELEVQISQVRAEMQAYTDRALKDLECKMHSLHQPHTKEHQAPDKKQKPSAPPSLASRRGRVLTRTMTTIIPKTCAPVIIGPRAKSETLSSSKGESSRLLRRDPVFSLAVNKPGQSHKPLLPPACLPLNQRKRPVQPRAKAGNS